MDPVWQLFDDEQIMELMKSFRERIVYNRAKKREYTSLQRVLYELRHELMARGIERKDWRNSVKNCGGND